MHSRSSYLAAALLLAGTSLSVAPARAAEAQDILVTTPLKVEKFIPLAEINQHPEIRVVMPEAVDPLAIYSDITTFTGQAFAQGAATGGITRMVMDDVTFTTDPAVGAWTWASGSQVWTGHIGILTANEAKKASHRSVCTPPTTGKPHRLIVSDAKTWVISVGMSVVPASRYIAIIATSIRTDPRKV